MKWLVQMFCAALAALALIAHDARPAAAQMPVIDPINLVQSILQAERALEQIHNQIEQIDQQAKMLAKNPLQLSPELSRSIGEARALFDDARGIAFELERLSGDIETLYPEAWEKFDLAEIGARSRAWLAEDRASIERAMRAQAQAASRISGARDRVARVLSASSDAEGQTGAVQAGNQLLGINAEQLESIHALLVAQGRALATERLERVAREERALEIQRRAFPGERAPAPAAARSAFDR